MLRLNDGTLLYHGNYIAIATLLPNRLEDQLCVRTAEAVRQFEYVGSEPCALL